MEIKIENSIKSIKEKRINLLFHNLDREIEYPNRLEITYQVSLDHYRSLPDIEPIVAILFKIVVPEIKETTKKHIDLCQEAYRSLVGRIALTLQYMIEKKKFMWKFPEQGLHPSKQVNIGDLIIVLSDLNLLKKYYDKSRCLD